MTDFRMPSLGADMEAGTLVEWLVKPGDPVKRGDVVAVVETQKGAIEIEIFHDGVMSELVVPVGQLVPVGTVLARLDGEALPRRRRCAADTCPDRCHSSRRQPRGSAHRRRPRQVACRFRRPRAASPPNAASISSSSKAPVPAARSPSPTSKLPNPHQPPKRHGAAPASIPPPCARPSPPR